MSRRLISVERNGFRTAKVYFDWDWNEYTVAFYTNDLFDGKASLYYTHDKEDALATARTIWPPTSLLRAMKGIK